MAHYRKIDVRIWNDEKFVALSDDAKFVFMFLLTHPSMTSLGAMRGTPPGLASELGWSPKRFVKAFRAVLVKGMARHDPRASFIGLPNFLKYNPPESPNVIKSWVRCLDHIPECELKAEMLKQVKDFTKDLGIAFQGALPEYFRKDMPNHNQKHEQNPKHKQKKDPPISPLQTDEGKPRPPVLNSHKPNTDEIKGVNVKDVVMKLANRMEMGSRR